MEEINNTSMNISEGTSKWLSDLEMDEYNLFPVECDLNFLDADEKELISHDIDSVFQEQIQQQHLTSESTLSNSFTDETDLDSFDFGFQKLTKDNNIITETISPKLSPSSSTSSFQSHILSFDNPQNSTSTNTPQIHGFTPTITSKQNKTGSVSSFPPQLENVQASTQNPKGSSKNQNLATTTSQNKRSRAKVEDHIMAERKRREKLSQSFIALAALVPNLKKMDKASVLADSIKYVKELKERLTILEEQNNKTKAETVMVLTKPDCCEDDDNDDNSSCDESMKSCNESHFQVEAKVLGKEMLIRIHCHKHRGILVKIIAKIQSFQLFVANSSVLPFGDSIDITIIAQMGEGYNLSIKEFVKNLRMEALRFMSSLIA